MALLPYAPLESGRFGLKIHRGVLDDISGALADEIAASRMDVAIFRLPCEHQDQLMRMDTLGYPWQVADSLVYFACDLGRHTPHAPRNQELGFVAFTPDHDDAMDGLVAEIFSNYTNHYTANPLFSRDLTTSYQEWARAYATDETTGRFAWLVDRGGAFIGFITCMLIDDEAEIVLNGVIPGQAGGGVYSDMVRHVQRFFVGRDCTSIKVSTQGHNYIVQKVWTREGFVPTESFFTIHVNSLLSAGAGEERVVAFNGADAIETVLDGCRADGFLPRDAAVTNARMKSIAPVRADECYEARIRIPVAGADGEATRVVVLVTDKVGGLCRYAHFELDDS
jgi:hypothetical protein